MCSLGIQLGPLTHSPHPSCSTLVRANAGLTHRFPLRVNSFRFSSSPRVNLRVRASSPSDSPPQGVGVENVVIIGSGPAGYTAAIYAARANLKPVVFEGYQVGGVPGGQLMTTTEVENFPGFPDGITGPDLMDRLGNRWTEFSVGVENVVIIGSGPAGYTAAIYAARANLKPVVFEGYQVGGVPGGQLMTTTEVENFPGFPDGITGPDLMDRMRRQAERWGAELHQEDVEFLDVKNRPFTVRSTDRKIKCHTVIVATGATAQRLGLPREDEFWSRGISACAICDGASPLFKGQVLAVVGGGDTATEEAIYLTKYARHVHLLVRRDQLRASKAMQDRVFDNPNITVHFNTETVDVVSNSKGQMSGVLTRKTDTGEESVIEVKGLFYGIGHSPNSQLLEGQVELDSAGYILVKDGSANTSVDGVFAAGDVQDHEWRQAVTAAGSGCVAALSVERYLTSKNLLVEFHQPHREEVKKEPTDRDVTESFDVTLTKHKGQYALRKLYHESPRLVCVLYTSPTCGPCRTLKPILNKLIDEYDPNVHFVEIDIEEDPEIAEAAGIMGTPCVQFFKNKEMLRTVSGVKMKKEYREFIEANK